MLWKKVEQLAFHKASPIFLIQYTVLYLKLMLNSIFVTKDHRQHLIRIEYIEVGSFRLTSAL